MGASADASKGLLGVRLREVAVVWATSQHSLVVLAAEFADSVEWVLDGSPSAAHWIGDVADVEACTYDHAPPYHQTGHTITGELQLRCAPCHRHRHNAA